MLRYRFKGINDIHIFGGLAVVNSWVRQQGRGLVAYRFLNHCCTSKKILLPW